MTALAAPRLGWAPLVFAAVLASAWLYNRGVVWGASLFLLCCLGLPWLDGKHWRRQAALRAAFAWQRQGWGIALAVTVGSILAVLFLAARLGYGFGVFLDYARSYPGEVVQWLMLVAMLALAEEFFFRGYLQQTVGASLWGEQRWGMLTRKNLFAALLFGVAHLVGQPPLALPGLVLGGLALGWLVEHSRGSIWPAVLLHAVFNLM
jgi:membrane protease YdiL (CAAX protease family)